MSPIFIGNRRIYGPESSDPGGLGASDEGSIVYNTTDDALKAWDGSAWNALGGSALPADSGNGGGWSVAQGASNTSGTYTTHTPSPTTRFVSSFYNSSSVSNDFFDYPGGGFGMHTGHAGNSTQWPLYMAVNVSTNPLGQVIDRIDWKKHSNACGNTDIWGSNQAITSSNYTNTSLYTYLGRVHFGGQSSGGEGSTVTVSFNPSQYGYQWYMMEIVDAGASTAYPGTSTLTGWAMYGQRWRKN
tara:strand:+ start:140 stop:868 length:729 start_codon:yes stop_codon:yes gene_type:complete